jgi:hypothetical protein
MNVLNEIHLCIHANNRFQRFPFQLSAQQAYISSVRNRKWQEMKTKSGTLRETAKMAADRAKAHTTLSASSVEPATKS